MTDSDDTVPFPHPADPLRDEARDSGDAEGDDNDELPEELPRAVPSDSPSEMDEPIEHHHKPPHTSHDPMTEEDTASGGPAD